VRTVSSVLPNKCIEPNDKSFNVNHFFFEQNCFLKDRRFDGGYLSGKMAGEIIMHFCNVYEINPRFIMVSLQRELGAIACQDESKFGFIDAPGYTQMKLPKVDWILCCGVPDNPKDLKLAYKGFENQVAGCCATYRYWINQYTDNSINIVLDKEHEVKPANLITWAMLRYTPHLSVIPLNDTLFKQYFPDYAKS
jgi:hypothetical protein